METESSMQAIVMNSKIQISNSQLHRLVKQKKQLVVSGILIINQQKNVETPQEKNYLLTLCQFKLLLKRGGKTIHVKQYNNSKSYLFQGQDGIIQAISIFKNQQSQQLILKFDTILQQVGVFKSFISQSCDGIFKKKVFEQYPNIQVQQIWDKGMIVNTTNYLVKGLGSVAGFIQSYTQGTANYIQEKYKENVDRLSKSEFGQNNKSKWQYVKDKAWQFDQKMTQYIKPIGQKTYQWASKIGQSYKASQNPTVKYIKKLSKATEDNLNEGYSNTSKKRTISEKDMDKMAEYQNKVQISQAQLKQIQKVDNTQAYEIDQ